MRPSRASSESLGNSSMISRTTYGRLGAGAACVELDEQDAPSTARASTRAIAGRITGRMVGSARTFYLHVTRS
jgi:hypothetical protein